MAEVSSEIAATTTVAAAPDATVTAASATFATQSEMAFASAGATVPVASPAQRELVPVLIAPPATEDRPQPAKIPAPPPVIVAGETVREEHPAPAPDRSAVQARPEQVLTLDWQTDLTQIETNAEKMRAARPQVFEEVPASHPKRVRPQLAPLDEGPLSQVETQHPEAATPAPNP
jgi:hypothetical protein